MQLARSCHAPKTAVAKALATLPLASAHVAMDSKDPTAPWYHVPITALDVECVTMRLPLVTVGLSFLVLIVRLRDAQRHATTMASASMVHAGVTLVSEEKTVLSVTVPTTARNKVPVQWAKRFGYLMLCLVYMKRKNATICHASASQDGLVKIARSLHVEPSVWPVEAFAREECSLNWSLVSWKSYTIRHAVRIMECVSAVSASAIVAGRVCHAKSPCAPTTAEKMASAFHSLPPAKNRLERQSALALRDGTVKTVQNLSASRPAMATVSVSTAHVHVSRGMKANHALNEHSICTATVPTSVRTTVPCNASPRSISTSKELESSVLWVAPRNASAGV